MKFADIYRESHIGRIVLHYFYLTRFSKFSMSFWIIGAVTNESIAEAKPDTNYGVSILLADIDTVAVKLAEFINKRAKDHLNRKFRDASGHDADDVSIGNASEISFLKLSERLEDRDDWTAASSIADKAAPNKPIEIANGTEQAPVEALDLKNSFSSSRDSFSFIESDAVVMDPLNYQFPMNSQDGDIEKVPNSFEKSIQLLHPSSRPTCSLLNPRKNANILATSTDIYPFFNKPMPELNAQLTVGGLDKKGTNLGVLLDIQASKAEKKIMALTNEMLLGNLNFKNGKYMAALSFYSKAIKDLSEKQTQIKLDEFVAYHNRAVINFRLGDDDFGLSDIEKANKVNPVPEPNLRNSFAHKKLEAIMSARQNKQDATGDSADGDAKGGGQLKAFK
eukprot:gene19066-19418_t